MSYTIQTRAFLKSPDTILKNLTTVGFQETAKIDITDTYYAAPEDISPGIHTYEKIGEDFRIRIIDNNKLIVQQHLDSLKNKIKDSNHDIYESLTLFEGKVKDLQSAVKMAEEKGYTSELITIKKSRKIFVLKETIINVDNMGNKVFIIEITNDSENNSEYEKIKKSQIKLLKNLGVHSSEIIPDGYTYRRITQHIQTDPETKKKLLKEELEALIKELREKEKVSGEAYKDTGDGWHENPTYESLWNDILILNNRILQIKKELQTI